ncbi:zinc ABC transporter substrate-binding protein [Cohaesibacter celericrescens]|uniref:High-affinity zinc uptake system protein ZnuA n=1 Tax=Cohaesibacter celericrescens TaxID=2067669 RepID=A0A2N5XRN0_9HYPH|nr:zinc ABC transporter substrate-binding protein [Cohaesibacter celericrescens]PLW77176.1 zinc transporter [Cohaesibacter celericrescens]
MRKRLLAYAVSMLLSSTAAFADAPSVAVDIPPIHSLVSQVMKGVGVPDLIVQQGASPHGYSLRPNEAKALQNADAIFWVGEALEPWLERSIDSLASDAKSVELMEMKGTTELEFREGATFEKHSHEEADDEHDHEAKGHDHAHEGENHGKGEEVQHAHANEGHDHDHHGHDPHSWLDPENARVWLDVIAASLSDLDPENAVAYAKNASEGKEQLAGLISEIKVELKDVGDKHFIVFHDAYQYFENRFGLSATGSIRLGDASDPSPARIKEIHDKVAELKIMCVFSEPQFNTGLVKTVFEGTEAKVGILDPLGSDLALGKDLYPQLIRNLSKNLKDCF